MKTTIQARTGNDATSSIARLYERTLQQIIDELLQNARRAGATLVRVDCDAHRCRVSDDGRGIADPQVLLSYGDSHWDEHVARERPAGLGFSALAGRGCTIGSATPEGTRWQATVPPEAFTGDCEVAIEAVEEETSNGTWIEFALHAPAETHRYAAAIVERAARYLPVEVELDGVRCERRDYLAGAVRVVEGKGHRIGVYRSEADRSRDRIGFHGIGASWHAPHVTADEDWTARVALDELGDLEFVLPGRDALIDNEAKARLSDEVYRAIYDTIERLAPGEGLAHRQYEQARTLGIEMSPAKARLRQWRASPLDEGLSWRDFDPPKVVDLDPGKVYWRVDEGILPGVQRQLLGRVLPNAENLVKVETDARYRGYDWYDRLTTVERVRTVEHRDHRGRPTGLATRVDLADEKAKWVAAEIGVLGQDREGKNREADFDDDLESLQIVTAPGADVRVDDLTQFLVHSFYRQSEDFDAESSETQYEAFYNLARSRAIEVLEGPREARLTRVAGEVDYHVSYLAAPGDTVRFTGHRTVVRHSRLWGTWYRMKNEVRRRLARRRALRRKTNREAAIPSS